MPKKSSRELILDAAEKVVLESGGSHMTLDAVANAAGVSKGGLFYNFPSKEALLQAMLVRHAERMVAARAKEYVKLPDGPARDIQAYVLSVVAHNHRDKRIGAALLAAVGEDLKLLAPVQALYSKTLAEIAAPNLRPERVAVISLATFGLWITELMGLSPLHDKQRKQVVAELIRMTEE